MPTVLVPEYIKQMFEVMAQPWIDCCAVYDDFYKIEDKIPVVSDVDMSLYRASYRTLVYLNPPLRDKRPINALIRMAHPLWERLMILQALCEDIADGCCMQMTPKNFGLYLIRVEGFISESEIIMVQSIISEMPNPIPSECLLKSIPLDRFGREAIYYPNFATKHPDIFQKLCERLEQQEPQGQGYIYKYMTLDNKKLQTLKRNECYLGLPSAFNDVFDAQLHLTEAQVSELYKNFPHFQRNSVEASVATISSMNMTSFTKKHPVDANSNNMWGLYADAGKGVCIEYSIISLIYHYYAMFDFLNNPQAFKL